MIENQWSTANKAFGVLIKVGAVTRLWHLIYSLSCALLNLKEDLSVMNPQLCLSMAFIELKKIIQSQAASGRIEFMGHTRRHPPLPRSHVSRSTQKSLFIVQTVSHVDFIKMKSFLIKIGFLWAGPLVHVSKYFGLLREWKLTEIVHLCHRGRDWALEIGQKWLKKKSGEREREHLRALLLFQGTRIQFRVSTP